jgi:restriction system protein
MENEYLTLMAPWHRLENIETVQPLRDVLPSIEIPEGIDPYAMIKSAHQTMMSDLSEQLLGYVYAQSHKFFEALMIDVMLAMGYGGRRRDLAHRIGRSGDGGIDGVISLDELGLDVIYLQAKRLRPNTAVPISAVRDFIGSLESKHATKGVFVTTAHFSVATALLIETISKKVVLIDGRKLSELMVRHNIGTVPTDTIQFKKIDLNYFSKMSVVRSGGSNNSASNHPRK